MATDLYNNVTILWGDRPFSFSHCKIVIIAIVDEGHIYVLWVMKNHIF